MELPKDLHNETEDHFRLYAEDDKIIIKFLQIIPESINDFKNYQIPIGLKEALKDVDQYAKVKLLHGLDANQGFASDKPIAYHYLKGISVEIDVCLLKNIKKAIMNGL